MRTHIKILFLALLTTTLGLTACSSMSQESKRLTGTGIGAAAGGIAGDVLLGSPVGIIGGAVAGGVAGNIVGNHY